MKSVTPGNHVMQFNQAHGAHAPVTNHRGDDPHRLAHGTLDLLTSQFL